MVTLFQSENWINYLLALIPIFVAIDVIGILPIFITLTEDIEAKERTKIVKQSIVTSFIVSMGFLVLGKFVFRVLGVSISDFKIAGGIILLIIATGDLLFPQKTSRLTSSTLGIVPLGTPLIVGPAVLTTILISVDLYSYLPTIFSLIVNLFLVWFVFSHATRLINMIGEGGAKAFGKVFSLLLAAIAVMMIRRGIYDMLCTN
ncbi:MAG: MarC family protein [Syntrophales bacterium]|nr:MarC family protein [Syntrophales bacterium]